MMCRRWNVRVIQYVSYKYEPTSYIHTDSVARCQMDMRPRGAGVGVALRRIRPVRILALALALHVSFNRFDLAVQCALVCDYVRTCVCACACASLFLGLSCMRARKLAVPVSHRWGSLSWSLSSRT